MRTYIVVYLRHQLRLERLYELDFNTTKQRAFYALKNVLYNGNIHSCSITMTTTTTFPMSGRNKYFVVRDLDHARAHFLIITIRQVYLCV